MDFVSPITDIVTRVWDCSARHTNYLRQLGENIESLRTEMKELKDVRDDVKRKVDAAEGQLMTRTRLVNGWIQRVEVMEREVDEVLQQGSQHIEITCLSGCCPKNCWSGYKFGKKVMKKQKLVADLLSKGDQFQFVAERTPLASVQEMPDDPAVGLDSTLDEAWSLLLQDNVGILGLYGMGGVGKTTVLRKINNKFCETTSDFDLIIWVVVSKEVNLGRIQSSIGERLGLSCGEGKDLDAPAMDIFKILKKKRFVLLLDDIWQRLDLSSIGIPRPNSENKCKVVFTTRSEAVCGRMEADQKIRVQCLNSDLSWALFKEKVGDETLYFHEEIPKLAEDVAKECCGLPLALITIGRAMSYKRTPNEWKHAITVLKKSASEYLGMEDEVLPILKFSYDSLLNDTFRSCFLYCSLYPEDYSIDKRILIEHWIGEGYIDGFDDMDEALDGGHDIIGSLKASCLLECGEDGETQVKMHDVIRDLALWISRECGGEKERVLVQAGVGLIEAPKAEKWRKAAKVSLMLNDFGELHVTPNCPYLSTLLLCLNFSLKRIHNDFFLSMHALKVLDCSKIGIMELPTNIGELVKLEYLDLSFTCIKELPCEIQNLIKLKYLFLEYTVELNKIPHGVLMHLSNLQILKVGYSKFANWDKETQACIGELECLNQLIALEIKISNFQSLERLLSCRKSVLCTRSLFIEIILNSSKDFSFTLSPSSTSYLCLGNMTKLRELEIFRCLGMQKLIISWSEGMDRWLLPNLETLKLVSLSAVVISWDVRVRHCACFKKLHSICLYDCNALVNLTWLLLVPNLKTLEISSCLAVEEVISDDFGEVDENTFSNLKIISLMDLVNLRSICTSTLPFPSLEKISIDRCSKLRRLPFDSNSAKNTLQSIKASTTWWDELEWDNEAIKSTFTPYHHAQ